MAGMLAAGIIPLGIVSIAITNQAGSAMRAKVLDALAGSVELRSHQVEQQMKNLRDQVRTLAQESDASSALDRLDRGFGSVGMSIQMHNDTLFMQFEPEPGLEPPDRDASLESYYRENAPDSSLPDADATRWLQYLYLDTDARSGPIAERVAKALEKIPYERAHAHFNEVLSQRASRGGFVDLILVEPENANIVYSARKRIDFATSLADGPFAASALGDVARRALQSEEGQVVITDFSLDHTDGSTPIAYAAAPVYEDDTLVGAVVVPLPTSEIQAVMTLATGLGPDGEALLLGPDGFMRTQSRFSSQPTVLTKRVHTRALESSVSQQQGELKEDRGGVDYLTAYQRLNVPGVDWTLVVTRKAEAAYATVVTLLRTTVYIAAAAVLCILLVSWLLSRGIHRTLGCEPREIRDMAKKIRDGELISDGDKAAAHGALHEMSGMRERLREVMQGAAGVAHAVRDAAESIDTGIRGLQQRSGSQADELQSTARNTLALSDTVRSNADQLHNASELALKTRDRAVSSGSIATHAVNAMEEISHSSEKISDIIGVIDEIAFQTNLLALNAAVEAARAGDQGRGFAVVASEVRQLAGRSAVAANEIKTLISDSVDKVRDGKDLVQQSGQELESIVEAVSRVSDIVGTVSGASVEQSQGIDQINEALSHIDAVTRRNVELAVEATETSARLTEQATSLSERIAYFTLEESKCEEIYAEPLHSPANVPQDEAATASQAD